MNTEPTNKQIKQLCDYSSYLALQLTKEAVRLQMFNKGPVCNIPRCVEILETVEKLINLSHMDADITTEQKRRASRITAYEMLSMIQHGQFDFIDSSKGVPI